MNALVLLLASAAVSNPAPADPPPEAAPTVVTKVAKTAQNFRFAGFAATLSSTAPIDSPRGWQIISEGAARAALVTTRPAARAVARWAYARSLIGEGRGQEARAVLEVMRASESDLALVDMFQLAVAAASAEAGDARGALAALGGPSPTGKFAANSEACAWRLWAFTVVDMPEAALQQTRCALRALNQRPLAARAPFLYAGARAAIAAGRPAPVAAWLRPLPANDAGANLYRARAALALGDIVGARTWLKRIVGGSRQQQVDAQVTLLETDLATGPATPAQLAKIDHLALTWRGDAIEQRVLWLSYRTGVARHDVHRSIRAGAALIRYCRLGAEATPLLAKLQAMLADGLAPGSTLPIAEAAGLFWDYRDLSPAGAQGDFLASQLADRLVDKGLYLRAAELLRHQLLERAQDVAQGPLSARVASLYILSGRPTQALAAIRATDGNTYPEEMQWERHRMEAVALYQMGRRPEARAAVQDVPDGAAIRAEIDWKAHDWAALVAEAPAHLPTGAVLSLVEQAIILRQAIALATLGRETALMRLHSRYETAFAGLPGSATFDLLTVAPSTLDGEALAAAMLAIPSVSPVGVIGDLLEVANAEPQAKAAARPAISDKRRG
ncbi:MAG: hypothetical protein H7316_05710 [Tardiphaga sp.]|uniref:hypothetical protein n=1 Tax=Tardiphaga sp. TaxID=1926292 RepID=UPI0019C559A0|nr:hypothetical protein [Tardiphaga sp.]MBC7583228.1 hypothetical protein [Tardiphaga sp.]